MKNLKDLNLSKYSVTYDGCVYSAYSKRFLKPTVGSDGYYRVTLVNDDGDVKYYRVSRLVAEMFCENKGLNNIVNHIDGDKLNNHYTNLEWTTTRGNSIHAIDNKLQTTVGGKDITDINTIHNICSMLEEGYRKKDICEVLNVERRKVTEILNGTYWGHISCEYNLTYVKKKNRLSFEKVREICEYLSCGLTLQETAKKSNVGTSTVHRIKSRKTYSDVSKGFDW